ncbi:unnamed protein product [Linum tenue]|uniref:Peroxidase n=1 Tax=Linum tenue TaxID=586396 RepID=A0AAV0QXV8_9ROSI|nr:unnamed protein product [Linum tenue]
MASASPQALFLYTIAAAALLIPGPTVLAQLTPDFYTSICPQALPTIRRIVNQAINDEPRMGASLLRMHFHDCFVNVCDDTSNFTGEKTAGPNFNSVRGYDVVDKIKTELDKICRRSIVSCADILAVAARDSVSILGGPSFTYSVLLGRRDATTASLNAANNNLPAPFFSFPQLLASFQAHGLDLTALVALSGGHTIGLARCTTFRNRIFNDTNIQTNLAASLQRACPPTGGDDNLQPMDRTPAGFDTQYFDALLRNRGLLHSDQELFGGGSAASDALVRLYSTSPQRFAADFAAAMVKMGNMQPLTGTNGEIESDCRKIN